MARRAAAEAVCNERSAAVRAGSVVVDVRRVPVGAVHLADGPGSVAACGAEARWVLFEPWDSGAWAEQRCPACCAAALPRQAEPRISVRL